MSANVMRSLESGVTQPEKGRIEIGRQGKFSLGQPGERSWQGANNGGHQVVQPKRMMVQRRAQPLTGDSVTYGDSMRASRSKKENKTGLPDRLKAGIENLSGYSMDDVRVHYNSSKPAQLQALAYAQGTDIHVGPGQEMHLPHEAWHVVQQMQGRVKPERQGKGVRINDDEGLELEAEKMGKRINHIVQRVLTPVYIERHREEEEAGMQPPVIQRKLESINTTWSDGELDVPAYDLRNMINYEYLVEDKSDADVLLKNPFNIKGVQVKSMKVPMEVKAAIIRDEDEIKSMERKRQAQHNLGKIGRDEHYLYTGDKVEYYEGGHLIPHFIANQSTKSAVGKMVDGYGNIVPMSASMNHVTWKGIDTKLKRKYNSLRVGEKLEMIVKVEHEEYDVSYEEISERFDVTLKKESDGKKTVELYGWIPTNISSEIHNVRTGSVERDEDMQETARLRKVGVISTMSELIKLLVQLSVWQKVDGELQDYMSERLEEAE
ncbi:MAG: DUF4157 domain-containing protein [Moorea sp. SIO2I5]|nr:DUF4157 domain-containing protein [Moorena sp. SIO2I5]